MTIDLTDFERVFSSLPERIQDQLKLKACIIRENCAAPPSELHEGGLSDETIAQLRGLGWNDSEILGESQGLATSIANCLRAGTKIIEMTKDFVRLRHLSGHVLILWRKPGVHNVSK